MDSGEKALYHQIHPFKLLVDLASGFFATVLFWQQQLMWGLGVAIVPPVIASAVLIRWANLEIRKKSALGRYMAQHMTANAQSTRLIGMLIVCLGAWYHVGLVIVLGLGLIGLGWAHGLLSPHGTNHDIE